MSAEIPSKCCEFSQTTFFRPARSAGRFAHLEEGRNIHADSTRSAVAAGAAAKPHGGIRVHRIIRICIGELCKPVFDRHGDGRIQLGELRRSESARR